MLYATSTPVNAQNACSSMSTALMPSMPRWNEMPSGLIHGTMTSCWNPPAARSYVSTAARAAAREQVTEAAAIRRTHACARSGTTISKTAPTDGASRAISSHGMSACHRAQQDDDAGGKGEDIELHHSGLESADEIPQAPGERGRAVDGETDDDGLLEERAGAGNDPLLHGRDIPRVELINVQVPLEEVVGQGQCAHHALRVQNASAVHEPREGQPGGDDRQGNQRHIPMEFAVVLAQEGRDAEVAGGDGQRGQHHEGGDHDRRRLMAVRVALAGECHEPR